MVACAGLGERLLPFTKLLPKPACPVLDRPLVHFNLALLKMAGVDEVVVNTHQLPEAMAAAARKGCEQVGQRLQLSHEPVLLGTGGGLKRAEAWLQSGGTFILINGKILCDVDLGPVLEAHRRAKAAATLLVVDLPPGEGYRPVRVGLDGRLLYVPGSEPATPSGQPFLFTGIHLLEPAIFDHLPPITDRPYGIFEQGYRGLAAAGATILAHRTSAAFHDPSTLPRYLLANLDAASGRFPLQRFGALKLGPLHPTRGYIAEGANVEGEVHESVVGDGARVPAGASVTRSVIWANTELGAHERLEGSIAAGALRLTVERDA
jgi:mannose-1-phosphate guanylyltransferase